jgi:hypothetical protein
MRGRLNIFDRIKLGTLDEGKMTGAFPISKIPVIIPKEALFCEGNHWLTSVVSQGSEV